MTKEKHSQAKWNIFFMHLLLFVAVHLLFVPLFGVIPLSNLGSASYIDYIAGHFVNHGVQIYQNGMINQISSIWKTVLIIHLIVEIIETLFPSKKKEVSKKTIREKKAERKTSEAEGTGKESNSKAWVYLIIAGILEIIWATALKMDMLGGPLIIVLIISFDLLIKSVKRLGVGTAYAVFTGIGVVGMVFVDVILFQESLSFVKILLLLLLVLFIIGLRFTSEEQEDMK
ncbi:MAG TPA: multidrug efflux SMR transporter [Bacillota bacterium]|nr:multidrug efflux SMR transporter [Bacillota bacterium]